MLDRSRSFAIHETIHWQFQCDSRRKTWSKRFTKGAGFLCACLIDQEWSGMRYVRQEQSKADAQSIKMVSISASRDYIKGCARRFVSFVAGKPKWQDQLKRRVGCLEEEGQGGTRRDTGLDTMAGRQGEVPRLIRGELEGTRPHHYVRAHGQGRRGQLGSCWTSTPSRVSRRAWEPPRGWARTSGWLHTGWPQPGAWIGPRPSLRVWRKVRKLLTRLAHVSFAFLARVKVIEMLRST